MMFCRFAMHIWFATHVWFAARGGLQRTNGWVITWFAEFGNRLANEVDDVLSGGTSRNTFD